MPNSSMASTWFRRLLFGIFAASGFSGLIYESVWSHYLKLVLGHAAYAQTLVLTIFMGGTALGAWLASRFSLRIANPLVAYAVVELLIGTLAWLFHGAFMAATELLYQHWIPVLASPAAIGLTKWAIAASLILVPSILLGTTFPLMSVGIMRLFPAQSGPTLSMLYFSNSAGAALGVLTSGFALLPTLGLPGTLLVAGALNLAVAFVAWLSARKRLGRPGHIVSGEPGPEITGRLPNVMLAAAALTGFASFCYEIAWIRMLSLAFGSTTHAFELMLSAFITGLALGGLHARRLVTDAAGSLRVAGGIQLWMSLFALATVTLYNHVFVWMEFLLGALQKNDAGYLAFHAATHGIALVVMFPTTFMAGMTLPLFTQVLIVRGHGEASVGRVYAANTLGAISGVLLGVHLVMPSIGAKGLVGLGALVDAGLGLSLLWLAVGKRLRRVAPQGIAVCLCFVVVLAGTDFDVLRMASGVFRTGRARASEGSRVEFHRDGKTATIDVVLGPDGSRQITTNGKVDASIQREDSMMGGSDEVTAVGAAIIPLALHPGARRVANIGLGSGQTAHALLGASRLERVDTVEIEEAVVEGARRFGAQTARVYTDPRSHIYVEDAKTFFATRRGAYDIIVSEPSNPWVSGVASLFSREFYAEVDAALAEGGVFVQWLQLYETNERVVSSIFRTLGERFSEYVVFHTNDMDLMVVAGRGPHLGRLDPWIFGEPGLHPLLERVRILDVGDLELRRLGTKHTVGALLALSEAPVNTDFFPFVDHEAARSRFLGESIAPLAARLLTAPIPVLDMMERRARLDEELSTATPFFGATREQRVAYQAVGSVMNRRLVDVDAYLSAPERGSVNLVAIAMRGCAGVAMDVPALDAALFELASRTGSLVTPTAAVPMWQALSVATCSALRTVSIARWLALYEAVASRDGAAMESAALRVLDAGEVAPDREDYAIGAGVLGAFASRGPGPALDLWLRVGGERDIDTAPAELRLLLAALADRIRHRPAGPTR